MKGTGALGLPSTSSTSGKGSFRRSKIVRGSATSKPCALAISSRPMASFGAQRCSEATQSVAVTALPSCHFRPSRSWKRQVRPSLLFSWAPTICGWIAPFSSIAKSVS